MNLTPEFWLTAMTCITTIGTVVYKTGGSDSEVKTEIKNITEKLDRLETKQDKHNNLISRMAVAESEIQSNKEKIKEHIDND